MKPWWKRIAMRATYSNSMSASGVVFPGLNIKFYSTFSEHQDLRRHDSGTNVGKGKKERKLQHATRVGKEVEKRCRSETGDIMEYVRNAFSSPAKDLMRSGLLGLLGAPGLESRLVIAPKSTGDNSVPSRWRVFPHGRMIWVWCSGSGSCL